MDSEEMAKSSRCDLPEALKQRLSTLWLKCFEILSRSNVPSSSAQVMLKGACFRQGLQLSQKLQSWEEVLLALIEEDAVLENGDLKLKPIFYNLPPVAQSRFLHLVQCNASKICSYQLKTFVTKLESVKPAKGSWINSYVITLRQYLDGEETQDKLSVLPKLGDYAYSAASKALMNDILEIPKNEKAEFLNTTRAASAASSPYGQNVNSHSCEKVVDVIVIEDGEEDTQAMIDFTEKKGKKHNESPLSKHGENLPCVDNNFDCKTVRCGAEPVPEVNNNSGSSIAIERKRKSSALNANHSNVSVNKAVVSVSDEDATGPVLKTSKSEPEGTVAVSESNRTVCEDQPSAPTVWPFSDAIKAQLVKLKEACFGENKTNGVKPNKLTFFLDLSSSEVESACDYLKLSDQTEEFLINFSDAVPWDKLEYNSAFALLTGCVFHKVTACQVQISQKLLILISSILKDHPQAVLDLLIKAVNFNQSNEFQCQVLTTLCKDGMSQEWLCYLIKLLNGQVVDVNVNLLAVLQAVIDRRPDFDAPGLTSLLALLTQSSQTLASSPRLGACLLACLTKYGKKMTSDDLTTFSSLVDVHSSNFKAALNATFKRLNR